MLLLAVDPLTTTSSASTRYFVNANAKATSNYAKELQRSVGTETSRLALIQVRDPLARDTRPDTSDLGLDAIHELLGVPASTTPATARIWDNAYLDAYTSKLEEDDSASLAALNSEGNFGYFLQRVKWMLETCTDENPMLVFLGRPWMLPKASRLRVLWEGRQGTRKGFRTLLEQQGTLLLETERGIRARNDKAFPFEDDEVEGGVSDDRGGRGGGRKVVDLDAVEDQETARAREELFLADLVDSIVLEQFGMADAKMAIRMRNRNKELPGAGAGGAAGESERDEQWSTIAEKHLATALRAFAQNLDETATTLQELYKFLRLTSHTHIVLGKRLLGVLGHYVEKCVTEGCPNERDEIADRVDVLAQNYVQDATVLLRGDLSRTDPRFWRALDETEKSLAINSTDPFFERRKYPNIADEGSSSTSTLPEEEAEFLEQADGGGGEATTASRRDPNERPRGMVKRRGPRSNLNKVQSSGAGVAGTTTASPYSATSSSTSSSSTTTAPESTCAPTGPGQTASCSSSSVDGTLNLAAMQRSIGGPLPQDQLSSYTAVAGAGGTATETSDDQSAYFNNIHEARHREYYRNLSPTRGTVGPLAAVYRSFDPKMTKEMLLSHYMNVIVEFLDALTAFIQKEANFPATMLQLVQKISNAHCGLQYRLNAHASLFLTTSAIKPPQALHPWSFDRRFQFEERACCRRYHVLGRLMEDLHERRGFQPLVGVEVGVNNAITSQYLLKYDFVNLTGLDPFINVTDSIQQMSYDVFARHPERCQLIKTKSEDYVHFVPDGSLDFVFIDGDHSFQAVVRDLKQWVRKVKPGGLVSGHDLFNPAFEGVYEALSLLADDYPKIHYGFDFLFYWWKEGQAA
eukprot:g6659.t1